LIRLLKPFAFDGHGCVFDAKGRSICMMNPWNGRHRNIGRAFAASPELLDALKEVAAIVDEHLAVIVDSHTTSGSDGKRDMSTLDEEAKPDVERFTAALKAARVAINKAEGRA
jgi:hypothetical protein